MRDPSPERQSSPAGPIEERTGGNGPSSSAPPSSLPGSSPPAEGFSDMDDDGVLEDGIATDGEEEGEGEDLFDDNMGK